MKMFDLINIGERSGSGVLISLIRGMIKDGKNLLLKKDLILIEQH